MGVLGTDWDAGAIAGEDAGVGSKGDSFVSAVGDMEEVADWDIQGDNTGRSAGEDRLLWGFGA